MLGKVLRGKAERKLHEAVAEGSDSTASIVPSKFAFEMTSL
jgi:hypothetical protein